jgi:hypothetical protein
LTGIGALTGIVALTLLQDVNTLCYGLKEQIPHTLVQKADSEVKSEKN